ncbi:hypothetical protein MAM1_0008c00933 [Mucor ambiguus]|uniref:DUF1772-domain-containing protein n=1 Tax=Mucor ambiguus TaxID=91626 RepID=A0A0C9LQI4_9FUNG|nr:hypothetical protein MAM1_0008c00933 [Mucor ambiguus]
MSSLSTLIYAPRSIGLFANGVFTGIGLCMNYVCVPAIKATKDPLPVFRQVYGKTSQIAKLSILVSTVANAVCYYRTKDTRFIYSTALSFLSFPFTLIFMMPVNNQLLAMEKDGANYDRKQVHQHVAKWNKLQYVRTLSGTAAFLINILYR